MDMKNYKVFDNIQEQNKSSITTLDDALKQVGNNGGYQKRVFLIIASQCVAQGMLLFSPTYLFITPQLLCSDGRSQFECRATIQDCLQYDISFPSPLIHDDLVTDLNLICDRKRFIAIASSLMFFGSILGNLFFNFLGDSKGRRNSLLMSWGFTTIGMIGIACSFNLWGFIPFNFIAGFGVNAAYNISFVLLNEISSESFRQKASITLLVIFAMTEIFTAILFLLFKSWRIIFFLFGCIPASIGLLLTLAIYETPIFYLTKNRLHDVSEKSLQQRFPFPNASFYNGCSILQLLQALKKPEEIQFNEPIINRTETSLNRYYFEEISDRQTDQRRFITQSSGKVTNSIKKLAIGALNKIAFINGRPQLSLDIIISQDHLTNNLVHDISDQLTTVSQDIIPLDESQTYGYQDLFHYKSLRRNTIGFMGMMFVLTLTYFSGQYGLNQISSGDGVYVMGACVGVAELCSYILILITIEKIPRKLGMLVTQTATTGLFSFYLLFGIENTATDIPNDCFLCKKMILIIILSCTTRILVSFGSAISRLYLTEGYPTVVRTIGTGFVASFSMLGSFTAPQTFILAEIWNINPYLIVVVLSLIGPLTTLLLKETKGIKMQDKISELI